MYHEFKGSRVLAIDYLPLLKASIKETIQTCNLYGIPFNTQGKHSRDVQKFFYHYCLDKFCTEYSKIKTPYTKVIFVYPLPKAFPFTEKNLDKILSVLPVPWCKVNSKNSPDLELACQKATNKKPNTKKTVQFADRNSLHLFLKGLQKKKIFIGGTVDFSSREAI